MTQECKVITTEKLLSEMDCLREMYDIVRLVDPASTTVVCFTNGKLVEAQKDPCFSVWEKNGRCQNCVSYQACREGRKVTKFEFKKDEAYDVLAVPYRIKDGDREYTVSLELVNKVTDVFQLNGRDYGRRELQEYIEQEKESLSQMVRNVPAGLFVFRLKEDNGLEILEANPSACQLMGIDFDKTIGSGNLEVMELTHPEDRSIIWDVIQKMHVPGTTVPYEYRQYNRQKNEYCWMSARAHSVLQKDGSIYIYISYFDITEQKKTQKLKEDLRIAKIESQAKTEFMSNMSHDMRTPLNGMLGLAYLMLDKTDVDELHDDTKQLIISGKLLLSLINDTLDISRIESGRLKLTMKPMDSGAVFKNVLTTAGLLAGQNGVQLVYNLPNIPKEQWITVIADPFRLEQVLINVISNAIKYSEPGGQVELHMESLSITEDRVTDRYTIVDHGIGMSEEFRPHLFEPFVQEGRVKTLPTQGSGLGMSIVKQLVDLMGGTITVESQLNVGTTVSILMNYDVYKGELSVEQEEQELVGNLDGMRVLLCEDHPLNRQIILQLLKKKGVAVHMAENGKEGLDRFQNSAPGYYHMILMDVRMPVMNGIDAVKAIRALAREDAKTIPIVAMTANAFAEDKAETRSAGMNEHLAKPVEPEILYHTLGKYFKQDTQN